MKLKESEKIEFKKSLAEKDEILESISAFANKKGGEILVGIDENKDGSINKITGIEAKGRIIENLTNEIKQTTDPVMFPSIKIKKMCGKEVLSIKIEESLSKPVFAKKSAHIRVGRTNRRLSVQEIKRMAKDDSGYSFTGQVCKEAKLSDLDLDFVKKFFIPRYESATQSKLASNAKRILESLGAIKKNKPTIAGILLFGKNPQRFFMNSYVAIARYKEGIGTERLDYKEFDGNIFQQIDKADKYVEEHSAMMSRLHPGKIEREDIPEYPLFSIRELITNSICHRDYSEQGSKVIIKMFKDCMEVYNPGGLAEGINPKNIANKQFSRNPILAKALSKVKYIEELGEGWDKIIKEHEKHPLKPKLPKINADQSSMLVTLFSTKDKFESLTEKSEEGAEKVGEKVGENESKILDLIAKDNKLTYTELSNKLKISEKSIYKNIEKLKKKELLQRKGPAKGGYWKIKK